MKHPVRVRVAPSPTGPIHVGLARTTLYNFLYARQNGGVLVLRIEDTDVARSKPEYEQQILDGFRWLGLHCDEGPDVHGPYAPYRQSERGALYREHLDRLIEKQSVYRCYCTTQELEAERAQQRQQGLPPVYSRKCYRASEEQKQAWESEGRQPIFRFAVPDGEIVFHDLIRGEVRFQSSNIEDFSVARNLDEPLYNLAVVVDDAVMQITHVIRGEDHISNTPKQLLLFRALGYPEPIFGHLPLLLAPNRSKLSKRGGETSLLEYRDQGFLPEAVVNFLALLGWNPKDNRELFTMDELVQAFRIEQVQKSGAIFDRKKLEHLNALYIRKLSPEEIISRVGDRLDGVAQVLGERLPAAIHLVQDRLTTFNELPGALLFLTSLPEYDPRILIPKKGELQRTIQILTELREFFGKAWSADISEQQLHDETISWLHDHGYSNAEALWPLRIALSGKEHSPGVFPIAAVLGQVEVLARIDFSIKQLKNLAK